MRRTSRIVLSIASLTLFMPLVQATPRFNYFPDPSLPDIAAVTYRPGKLPVISFNPLLCKQAGKSLCEFYRYHEIAHIVLRHNDRTDLSTQEKESEADRWAAKHAPVRCVKAAYRFFSKGGGATPNHGSSQDRAKRMIARIEKR